VNIKPIKTAIILCGGNGTRLGEIGKKIPKTLVKIQQKPILWYILKILLKNKINHFILPVGHKGKLIKNFLKKFEKECKQKILIDVVATGKNTIIANRIFKVSPKIISDNFLLLNGDAIFDFNLSKIIKNHIKSNLHLTLMTCKVISTFGVVVTKDNKPVNFKRDLLYDSLNIDNTIYKGSIFTGMSLINKKILNSVNYKSFSNFEISFYPKILKKSKSSYTQINGFWYAMDNPKEIIVANKIDKKNKISKYISQLKKRIYND